MKHVFQSLLLIAALLLSSQVVTASDHHTNDRFWILWEKRVPSYADCVAETECKFHRRFSSRQFSLETNETIMKIFGLLDGAALTEGRLAEDENAPRICEHDAPEVKLGFDPEVKEISPKLDALKNLTTVGVDLRSLKAPLGFPASFGEDVHNEFTNRLSEAGLNPVRFEEADQVPGQPKFKLYFSFTDKSSECAYQYSFFSTLTQTALLTRDLETKVEVGIWSHMDKRVGAEHVGREDALILGAADALIDAWRRANETPFNERSAN